MGIFYFKSIKTQIWQDQRKPGKQRHLETVRDRKRQPDIQTDKESQTDRDKERERETNSFLIKNLAKRFQYI